MNLAFWTPLGAVIGLLLSGRLPMAHNLPLRYLIIASVIFLAIHAVWVIGSSSRDRHDTASASEITQEMLRLVNFKYSEEIAKDRERLTSPHRSLFGNYSIIFQLGVTLCLLTITVLLLTRII